MNVVFLNLFILGDLTQPSVFRGSCVFCICSEVWHAVAAQMLSAVTSGWGLLISWNHSVQCSLPWGLFSPFLHVGFLQLRAGRHGAHQSSLNVSRGDRGSHISTQRLWPLNTSLSHTLFTRYCSLCLFGKHLSADMTLSANKDPDLFLLFVKISLLVNINTVPSECCATLTRGTQRMPCLIWCLVPP